MHFSFMFCLPATKSRFIFIVYVDGNGELISNSNRTHSVHVIGIFSLFFLFSLNCIETYGCNKQPHQIASEAIQGSAKLAIASKRNKK